MRIAAAVWVLSGPALALALAASAGYAQEEESGPVSSLFGQTGRPSPDGPVPDSSALDGPALDGPALDGPALDGPALDGSAPARADTPLETGTPKTGTPKTGIGAEESRSIGPDGTPLGWDYMPELSPDDTQDDPLTELEKLSKSATGVGFNAAFYDADSDNPLTPVSVTLRALDKITAQYADIEVPLGQSMRFGTLELLPRVCDRRPPEEFPETTAFIEIFDTSQGMAEAQPGPSSGIPSSGIVEKTGDGAATPDQEMGDDPTKTGQAPATEGVVADEAVQSELGQNGLGQSGPGQASDASVPAGQALFRGWMFASSVGLSPLDHPVYDVWVIDCKMVDPEQRAESL